MTLRALGAADDQYGLAYATKAGLDQGEEEWRTMSASNYPRIVTFKNSISLRPILKGFCFIGTAEPVSMLKRSPFAGTAKSIMLVANTSAMESSI